MTEQGPETEQVPQKVQKVLIITPENVSDELDIRDHLLKGIRHEDSLVHQRITWLMVLNGFLFAFLGQLMRVRESRRGLQEQAILNIEKALKSLTQDVRDISQISSNIKGIKDSLTQQASPPDLSKFQNTLNTVANEFSSKSNSLAQIQTDLQTISNDTDTVKNAFGDLSGALSATTWIGIISSAILLLVIGFYWYTSDRRWRKYDTFFDLENLPSAHNTIPIEENQRWGWLIMLILLSIPGFLIYTWFQLRINVL
ncbi:MAG: hypothetical protein QNJ72_18210 [Pleurocapsa sp. MO_226.B13]|nr:hypothetical protein [Pleurocapsa sp. MO_226.B13]